MMMENGQMMQGGQMQCGSEMMMDEGRMMMDEGQTMMVANHFGLTPPGPPINLPS